MVEVLWCKHCQVTKPAREFKLIRLEPEEVRSRYCRLCEKAFRLYPAWVTIKGHGMTLDDYDRLMIKQDERCAICKRQDKQIKKALFIDHDHKCCPGATSCGKCVRGLLCSSCNYGLGVFKDNTSSLRNAAAYLGDANDRP